MPDWLVEEGIGETRAILLDGEGDRAKRVLDLLSDPSTEPIDKAPMKGATGAWSGYQGDPADTTSGSAG